GRRPGQEAWARTRLATRPGRVRPAHAGCARPGRSRGASGGPTRPRRSVDPGLGQVVTTGPPPQPRPQERILDAVRATRGRLPDELLLHEAAKGPREVGGRGQAVPGPVVPGEDATGVLGREGLEDEL